MGTCGLTKLGHVCNDDVSARSLYFIFHEGS